MPQGVLPFQYGEEKSSTGMTALSGLPMYMELVQAAGLRSSMERHVGLREGGQGWTDSQVITSLIVLNLAGGESVVDLDVLARIHRRRASGQCPEAARGCSCESGIMVFETKNRSQNRSTQ